MHQRIGHIALTVKEYNEAIEFYVEKLGFNLLEDTQLDGTKRWVVISPSGAKECSLLLAKAVGHDQISSIGNQTGGRVFLYLFTDNFDRDYARYKEIGVKFVRKPTVYGMERLLFLEDLYGNMWDLLKPSNANKGFIKESSF